MKISQNALTEFSNRIFINLGMPEEEAETVTQVMLEADLRNVHSHGFLRLPIYVERIQKGLMKNRAEITYENESISSAVIDGRYSAGQVVAKHAMEKSIEIADETGVGLVAVKNSNHFGIASYYSLLAAKQHKICFVISNVAPLMPAIGGKEKVIGNNPISIAAPSNDKPIVLDMALSNTAFGKILYHKEKGMSIPDGWGVDSSGAPTNDPNDVINGGLLSSVGGPKGFSLAVMAEILTGVLSGGAISKQIPSMYDTTKQQSISHFMLTIDIKKFIPLDTYYQNIDVLTNIIKNSSKAEGVENIYMPGEIEFMNEEYNQSKDLNIEESIVNQLNEIAEDLGIEKL